MHIHTGINARRYLLGLDDVSVRTKAIGLVSWATGVEVRYLDATLQWPLDDNPTPFADGMEDSQSALLEAIENSIKTQPGLDIREITVGISELVLPEVARTPLALARRYVQKGYDPEALFHLTATLVCRGRSIRDARLQIATRNLRGVSPLVRNPALGASCKCSQTCDLRGAAATPSRSRRSQRASFQLVPIKGSEPTPTLREPHELVLSLCVDLTP